jgi:hypothetical protein
VEKIIDTQPELPHISPAKKQYLIKKIKRIFHYFSDKFLFGKVICDIPSNHKK